MSPNSGIVLFSRRDSGWKGVGYHQRCCSLPPHSSCNLQGCEGSLPVCALQTQWSEHRPILLGFMGFSFSSSGPQPFSLARSESKCTSQLPTKPKEGCGKRFSHVMCSWIHSKTRFKSRQTHWVHPFPKHLWSNWQYLSLVLQDHDFTPVFPRDLIPGFAVHLQ